MKNYKTIAVYHAPEQISGYEYQVYASIEAIEKGWLESPYMPHAETLRIMKQKISKNVKKMVDREEF